jgi:hypothetical protein
LKNHHQCSVDTTPLPEVHYNVKGKKKVDVSSNHQKNFGKFKKDKHNGKNRKNRAKGQGNGKGKAFKCHKCGGPNHFARKYPTPQHLVELCQKSLKEANGAKDHMRLISTMYPRRQLRWELKLKTPKFLE